MNTWARIAAVAVLVGAGTLGMGCRHSASAVYEDPAGRFRILPFTAQEQGLDASGTARRQARIDVAMPGGNVEHVVWHEEEYADGAADNWKWTLVDERTGLQR